MKKIATEESFLTIDEASALTGFKKSYLYKMTMRKTIPFYRVGTRTIRFKKSDLLQFLSKCRVPSNAELEEQAARTTKKGRK